jgi:hypothetical protein
MWFDVGWEWMVMVVIGEGGSEHEREGWIGGLEENRSGRG